MREKWLEALESGEYQQTTMVLHDGRGYCCLGVAARVMGKTFECLDGVYFVDNSTQLLRSYREIGLRSPAGSCALGCQSLVREYIREHYASSTCGVNLTTLNDELGLTFKQIADILRKFPEAYFISEEKDE